MMGDERHVFTGAVQSDRLYNADGSEKITVEPRIEVWRERAS